MKQSERYFRQVKRHIPIGGLRKKEFLCNLQESLAAYAAKNPSALLSDYYAHFRKPEDIAVSFLSEMPYAEINSRMRKGHKAFVMVICIALVAVILLFSTIARMIVENRSSHNGYFIDGEPEIITNID